MAVAQPSASKSPTLIASDGLEYENITQRLLGNPLENERNQTLRGVRRDYPANEAAAWVGGYDASTGSSHTQRFYDGWAAVRDERKHAHPS